MTSYHILSRPLNTSPVSFSMVPLSGSKICIRILEGMEKVENGISSNPQMNRLFLCHSDNSWISFVQVCDGQNSCPDAEDEKSCHFSSAQMCDILTKLKSSLKNHVCPQAPYTLLEKKSSLFCPYELDFPSIYPKIPIKYLKNYCIYELNECGKISSDASGQHLMSCEHHPCNATHYKCPGFYCVPWPYVCDGIWQCPGGMEEMNCSRRSCKNQFHCKNSSICLHINSICDEQLDCPLNDDEVYCQSDFPKCPLDCKCLLYKPLF